MDDARGKARVRELVEGTDPTPGSVSVEAVRLMESTGSEPRYRTVERVPLEK
jgi:2'-5' RNA ligase